MSDPSFKRPKWVLVTGGGGFIGSHVIESFSGAGWQAVAVDNLSLSKIFGMKRKSVDFCQSDPSGSRRRAILVAERYLGASNFGVLRSGV